jgi:hypothetical protein
MKDFEKLIEYVINDEEDKARELFHDIVVAKSREIYEEMMDDEEVSEAKEEDDDEEEVTESEEDEEDEEVSESLGGDSADDLIDDVEAEEEGMNFEGEEDMDGEEDGAEHGEIEGKLMDIEDKLDELMSEFEALMSDGGADLDGEEDFDLEVGDGEDEMDMDVDMDMGDEEVGDEEEVDFDDEEGMMEAISLKAAPKPVTSEEGNTNKKSPTAFNSGATGMAGKPVHTGASMGGKHDSAAYKNTTKDLISDVQNAPARSSVKLSPATKPHLAQATGVNTKSPVGKA